jgi:hypothetical protein
MLSWDPKQSFFFVRNEWNEPIAACMFTGVDSTLLILKPGIVAGVGQEGFWLEVRWYRTGLYNKMVHDIRGLLGFMLGTYSVS